MDLDEYLDWLDQQDRVWPDPGEPVPPQATPALKPLPGIRAVTWEVYGTLLRIDGGTLRFEDVADLQLQVALEKTIHEFNMWHSMTRRPGPPWQSLLPLYQRFVSDERTTSSVPKGEVAGVNSVRVWRRVIDRLLQKDYSWDVARYGDLDELAEKVAYFFHANLQGVRLMPGARKILMQIADSKLRQGLLTDAQPFTLTQMLRLLGGEGKLLQLEDLFDEGCLTLSCPLGVRKPSELLYRTCLKRFQKHGIGPSAILHVGSRIGSDLAVAKRLGMRTVLFAGDRESVEAHAGDLKDPQSKPDRLITQLTQLRQIIAGGQPA